MKILRMIAPCLIASALVVACEANTPTEQPTDLVGTPAFAADQNWTHGKFYQDGWMYVDCLGEDIHYYGWVLYKYHGVTSASGNYNFHFQLLPYTPKDPPFQFETASGVHYVYKTGGPINESFHLGPGETHTMTWRETYVADNGDKLLILNNLHATTNANGELKVYKTQGYDIVCLDK